MERFAGTSGLTYEEDPALPKDGGLLGEATVKEGAAGKLPETGSAAQVAYVDYTTTDSDHHTYHHPRTVVVTKIPASIGFAPYIKFTGEGASIPGLITDQRNFSADGSEQEGLGGGHIRVYDGTSDDWLHQLFSPALVDWLARSADDFAFELSSGVLSVSLEGNLTGAAITTLWADAGHLAKVIETECQEEIDSGTASSASAKKTKKQELQERKSDNAIEAFGVDRDVPNISDAEPKFRSMLTRSPAVWMINFVQSIAIVLVINIPGIALPIVTIVNGAYLTLAVIEGLLLAITYFFMVRSNIRGGAKTYAQEAFYRAYARDRKLTLEDPLQFAATHAEAGLPFSPERVMTGTWPDGVKGSLMLMGDGSKRSDQIALVSGPSGPVSSTGLESSAPGLSAGNLDTYVEDLATKPSAAKA